MFLNNKSVNFSFPRIFAEEPGNAINTGGDAEEVIAAIELFLKNTDADDYVELMQVSSWFLFICLRIPLKANE